MRPARGAHGYAQVHGTLVDLRSGRIVPTPTVFSPDADWLHTIGEIVRIDLRKQFGKRAGFEDALAADNVIKLLRQYSRYIFKRDVLTVVFNPYEVAPYSSGQFFVEIPYSRLRAFLRVDGPLGGS